MRGSVRKTARVAAALPWLALLMALTSCQAFSSRDTRDPLMRPVSPVRERRVDIRYTLWIDRVPDGTQLLKVWVPIPREIPEVQRIEGELLTAPFGHHVATDALGNRFLFFSIENPPKVVHASYHGRVVRRLFQGAYRRAEWDSDPRIDLRFTAPNRRVPVDGRIAEIAATLPRHEDPVKQARVYFDHVLDTMRYSEEGTGWGQGSTEWAVDHGYGDSSDFHSYFLSLCRHRGIPTRFETGFALPLQAGAGQAVGYHCWASFNAPKYGWIPVDIFQAHKDPENREDYFAALPENRIAFAIGRDLVLTPPQNGPPLNIVIYPYAEADGEPVSAERMTRTLDFWDL